MHVPATHPSLHIRSVHDAMLVFEAVRRGLLPLICRRLSASEREALHPGCVFVWEEGEHKQGLERWTDGRRWSQSRLRNDFLYYDEKQPITQEERELKAARRAEYNNGCSSTKPIFRRSDRPTKPNGLTKQTYSTLIRRPGDRGYKKWHIVAYFTTGSKRLPVIEDFDYLKDLRIPEGFFAPSRTPASRPDQQSSNGTTSDDESPSSPGLQSPPLLQRSLGLTDNYTQATGVSLTGYYPLPASTRQHHLPFPTASDPTSPTLGKSLPLARRARLAPISSAMTNGIALGKPYSPLTPEDARALDSFAIRL